MPTLYKFTPENKSLPSTTEQIFNAAKAAVKFVASGMKTVTQDQYNERIEICDNCEKKTDDWRCEECGCYLTVKAWSASEDCPYKNPETGEHQSRWPKLIELPVLQENKGGKCGGCRKT